MILKQILLPALITLLSTTAIFAQTSQEEITPDDLKNIVRHNVIEAVQATETIGTPYLFDDFEDGFITLADGKNTASLQLNFNIYENRVEFSDAGSIIAVDNEMVDRFSFNTAGTEMVFAKGFDSRRLDNNEFVQVLADGQVKLLKKYEVSFQENVATYGTATQKDEYISNERYYIYEDAETNQLRSLSERQVLRTLNDHRDEMESYINENDLDIENTEDLARLIQYYNELKD
jgi:hypothetical protein